MDAPRRGSDDPANSRGIRSNPGDPPFNPDSAPSDYQPGPYRRRSPPNSYGIRIRSDPASSDNRPGPSRSRSPPNSRGVRLPYDPAASDNQFAPFRTPPNPDLAQLNNRLAPFCPRSPGGHTPRDLTNDPYLNYLAEKEQTRRVSAELERMERRIVSFRLTIDSRPATMRTVDDRNGTSRDRGRTNSDATRPPNRDRGRTTSDANRPQNGVSNGQNAAHRPAPQGHGPPSWNHRRGRSIIQESTGMDWQKNNDWHQDHFLGSRFPERRPEQNATNTQQNAVHGRDQDRPCSVSNGINHARPQGHQESGVPQRFPGQNATSSWQYTTNSQQNAVHGRGQDSPCPASNGINHVQSQGHHPRPQERGVPPRFSGQSSGAAGSPSHFSRVAAAGGPIDQGIGMGRPGEDLWSAAYQALQHQAFRDEQTRRNRGIETTGEERRKDAKGKGRANEDSAKEVGTGEVRPSLTGW